MATADGNGLFYGVRGPMGTVQRGLETYAVGRRGDESWSSKSALPAGSSERIYALSFAPHDTLPSSDLSKVLFGAFGSFVPDNPETLNTSVALYLGHEDGAVDWLTRPLIPNPNPAPGTILNLSFMQPVGASPDLRTIYFWSGPTLLPEDDLRTAAYDQNDPDAAGPYGMYEYTDGVLKAAGTLPDGTQNPGGAAPAATGSSFRLVTNFTTPDTPVNQVSRDGSTLWFVSPDPGPNPATSFVTQLYVRRNGDSTLVSHNAAGVAAPSGATPVGGFYPYADPRGRQYAYGAPDGSRAIFQSVDPLTADAPNDTSVKTYMYDVADDEVTYLAGVSGTPFAASDDGQRFMFGDYTHIGLWDHGTVKSIASVGAPQLAPARATADGSVFLFSTQAAIPGFNSGGVVQVYRYDVARDETTCLSCPPDGVTPTGDARLFMNDDTDGHLLANRGMSSDGGRVFFDTPDPLVSRDTNGTHRDVYEWTAQGVSLISSGRSQDDSYILDNSASGDDVFFTTTEGLDPRDTDGGYDVYDARVGGGFTKVDVKTPCVGDACQGGASPAPDVAKPGSAGFSGPGNEAPPAPKSPASTKITLGSHEAVKGGIELTIKIARPGRVTVTSSGLRSYKKTYAKAGTYKIKVSLTAKAKKAAKKHKQKLSVRVGFTPNAGKASSVKFSLTAKA